MLQFVVIVTRTDNTEEIVAGPFDSKSEALDTREDLAAENAEIPDAALTVRCTLECRGCGAEGVQHHGQC